MKIPLLLLLSLSYVLPVSADEGFASACWDIVRLDHLEFYSTDSLWPVTGGLLVGGVLANTSLDQQVNEWWQEDMRSDGTDDLAKAVKSFGDGKLTVPVFIGAALLGELNDPYGFCATVGDWGKYSLRSLAVGVPPLLLSQRLLGGSRPTDDEGDSTWRPFQDSNAVSGHAFMGAVPFLSAARMTESYALKTACFAGSMFCGFSRLNDEDHYLSQVLMGWGLAYVATAAVDRTEKGSSSVASIQPVIVQGCPGVALSLHF